MAKHLLRRVSMFVALGVAAVAFGAAPAKADFINGSMSLGTFGITANTGNILTATSFTFSFNKLTVTGSTGDFAPFFPPSTPFLNDLATATSLTTAGSFSMTFDNGNGSFTASNLVSDSSTTTTNFRLRDITLVGNFTPAGAFAAAGYQTTMARIVFSFNQPITGGAIGGGISLFSPAAAIPEPASMAMLAMGGLGVLGAARRRKATV